MAELLLNPEDRRTKQEKCNEVGIAFTTLWKWMKDKRYVDYVNSQLDQYTNSELTDIWKSLIMQCKRGNIQAIKLFFEMKELHPSIKIEQAKFDIDKAKANGGSGIEANNERILTLAKLINNPVPNRNVEDFEEDD
ncbi:phBC6A51 family helix-turn-helix protein [Desulfosporosinus sp. PR]|nr:phBC6A51 family helix-turn-helix protein [Desulfosporosinus sp. PR]